MNLKEFKTRLAKHDWYYSSSDDMRRYNEGFTELMTLKTLMQGKKTYEKAYKIQFKKHFK